MPESRRMKAKIALIGESAVGKTSLIRRFVKDEYDDKYLRTIGTKVSKIELTVPHGDVEVIVDLSIFDIMGQKGFKDMIKDTFFHGCQGILAVCDVTRAETLTAIHDWMSTATGIAGDVPAYLLVNKMDLPEHHRGFPFSEVEKVSETWEMPFVYTSAKTGAGVDDAFNLVAIAIVDNVFLEAQSHLVEEDLRHKVLLLVARRGRLGVTKEDLFAGLKGISYTELERELIVLEREALIAINWRGPSDFTVEITPLGQKATQGA
jgi:small GTP-binding protein